MVFHFVFCLSCTGLRRLWFLISPLSYHCHLPWLSSLPAPVVYCHWGFSTLLGFLFSYLFTLFVASCSSSLSFSIAIFFSPSGCWFAALVRYSLPLSQCGLVCSFGSVSWGSLISWLCIVYQSRFVISIVAVILTSSISIFVFEDDRFLHWRFES